MFGNPSLMTRIAVGKIVGFVIGLAGLILLPYFAPDAGWLIRWGLLLWYTTMGAVIGVFGTDGMLTSPFWFTLEGAVVGLVIGFFATRFGGEGAETVGN